MISFKEFETHFKSKQVPTIHAAYELDNKTLCSLSITPEDIITEKDFNCLDCFKVYFEDLMKLNSL